MRAARYYGTEDIRVEEIEEPKCGEGQIKVKPAFVGICGTDLHEFLGGPTFAPRTPHPITKETVPVTFGHEFSGTIVERVAVQPTIFDGTCGACKRDLQNVCYNAGFVGLSGWGGGLSDACVVPADYALPIPDNIPLDVAALVEPLSDSDILILGGGPIGIAVILALRARGCGKIIVSEPSTQRQKFDTHFGADVVLDPRKDDIVKSVQQLTNGEGVDIVFDCAGVAVGLAAGCKAIKVKGTVVNVAIWEKAVPFQPNDLVFKEGKYVACLGYIKQDFKDVIKALGDGHIKPADMITSKVPLERVVEDGFKELINNKEKHVKVLVQI
ncbi:sorbitol dehydrogenase [Cadophora sp. MPI-SDFR-AT-0126]|nr:sorbitol dehydrogenase [Leotiomycetes sp. MPI-SDFR-AT-0126]